MTARRSGLHGFGARLVVAPLALAVVGAATGCRPLVATRTAAEHRAEARALVRAGSARDAHQAYELAIAAGDEIARVEDGVLRAGGSPAPIDELGGELRVELVEELAAIDRGSELVRALYASASASLVAALALAVAGTVLVLPCVSCETARDSSPWQTTFALSGAIGGLGLVLLGTAIGLDVDSCARRGRWRQRVDDLRFEPSVGPDHAALVIAAPW